MKKDTFINMEKEIFSGNVLDIGLKNYGIIYNIYKEYNDEVAVEYVSGKNDEKSIENGFYDFSILFFTMSSIWLSMSKSRVIKRIYDSLKDDGYLFIWDIDKGYRQIFNGSIKVLLPNRIIKNIHIKNYNILQNNSKTQTVKLMENYFEVIDLKASDGIYYIKAKKKGQQNESIVSRH